METILKEKLQELRSQDYTSLHLIRGKKYNENVARIFDLLKRATVFRESGSALLSGPRNSGKATMIACAMHELEQKYPDHVTQLHKVRLNGSIHSDDRLALREIARQLNTSVDIDYDAVSLSAADCLAVMLSVLRGEQNDDDNKPSVVFVLEEFDCFAQHATQSLLYNLLDSTLTSETPLVVLGLTTWSKDCLDLLEKRVRSRFSQRSLICAAEFSEADFFDHARQLILIDNGGSKAAKQWNAQVNTCFRDTSIRSLFNDLYEQHRNIGALRHFLYLVLLSSTKEHPLSDEAFATATQLFGLQTSSYYENLLADLSVVELTLIIAAKHRMTLDNSIGCETVFNFEMISADLEKFCARKCPTLNTTRSVRYHACDRLLTLQLFRYVAETSRGALAQYRNMFLNLPIHVLDKFVRSSETCPSVLRQWCEAPAIVT